jgi:hypothetical protein
MRKKKFLFKKIKQIKVFIVAGVILFVIGLLAIFQYPGKQAYVNTEYNYKFLYPKESKISFISSLEEDIDITKADTIAVEVSPQVFIRIQALRTAVAHSGTRVTDSIQLGKNEWLYLDGDYISSNKTGKVTLFLSITPDFDVERLINDKVLVKLLSSIEFF